MSSNPGAARLARIVAADPSLAAQLAPGASEDRISAFAEAIGVALPEGFFDLHRRYDGNRPAHWNEAESRLEEAGFLFPGSDFTLHSLDEMARWKTFWDDLSRTAEAMTEEERLATNGPRWSSAWLPIAMTDYDVHALATEPCFGGPRFQVLRFDTKSAEPWEVVSPSFDDFLGLLATVIERGGSSIDQQVLLECNPAARVIDFDAAGGGPERFAQPGRPLAERWSAVPTGASALPTIDEWLARNEGAPGVERGEAIAALVEALSTAAARVLGDAGAFSVDDDGTGHVRVVVWKTVVEQVEDPTRELPIELAREVDPDAELGSELGIALDYVEGPLDELGRPTVTPAVLELAEALRTAHREALSALRVRTAG